MFFAVGINELALKRAFKTVFNSSSRAVMGISVVFDVKPRVGSLWAVDAIGGADEFSGQRGIRPSSCPYQHMLRLVMVNIKHSAKWAI